MEERSGSEAAEAGAVFTARPDRRKMTDWVCDELREAIVNLRLRPGEPA